MKKGIINDIGRRLNSLFKPENEEVYTMLFERSPLPQAIVSTQGDFLEVNTACTELHGIDRDEFIGKSPIELGFSSPVELRDVLEVFRKQNRLEGYMVKYPLRNGALLYVRIFAHSITLNGRSAILIAFHDVSHQHHAEKTTKSSERFLHTVLNAIPTRVFWKDRNSVFRGCNQVAATDLGYASSHELVGKTDYDLFPKDIADKFVKDDQRVINTLENSLFFEETQVQINGPLKWRLTSKVPLKDQDGNVVGLLGTYDDITARKQAEAALKLARFSIDHASSSIVWISKNGQIVDFNPSFCTTLLYTRDELLSLCVPDIDPHYTMEKWPLSWEALRQQETLTFLTKHRRKDGQLLDVEVRAHFLEFNGEEYNCAFVNDITERKKTEEQLHLSHSFQQAVLNNIPSGVFWKDRESKYLGANTFFRKLANCEPDEDLTGKTDFEFPWAEQAEQLRADDRYVIENNVSKLYFIEPLRNADGKIHYNEVSKVPLTNAVGEVVGVLGTFRDITEQIEFSLALKESEKLFKSVVQNASAIIYIIDNEGIFQLSEGLGLEVLGLRPGQVIGQSVFEMYRDVPEITKTIRRALKGEIISNEVSINGLTFANRYTPRQNEQGAITGILCVSFDITSRKKLEEELGKLNQELEQHVNELRESELKFRQIIQSSPMGIYVYEVNANSQLVLVDTNPAADTLTGIKNAELIGMTIDEAFPDQMKSEIPAHYLRAALDGIPWFTEDFNYDSGTIKGIFQIYAFQAGHNRMAVMFLNITESKQIEAAIKQKNEELIKANAELDRFVYSASHDLRAPIASLLGLIGVARAEKDMQAIGTLLDMQERTLLRLDEFISDIVRYSRNNRLDVEISQIDFKSLIEEIFEHLHFMEKFADIDRKIDISPDLKFSSDGKRISIILNNLISNAIKYADPDKENPFVEVRVERHQNGVTICVIDNGQGIETKHLSKIFDMFFRATQRSTGSGIGLYIVKEIVQKMSGSIEVESTPGRGSKFFITLPDLSGVAN